MSVLQAHIGIQQIKRTFNFGFALLTAIVFGSICPLTAQPSQSQVLELSGKKKWDRFGSSLTLQNDIALVRSREKIYSYKFESNAWQLKQVFQGHDSETDQFKFFGEAIDMGNEFAVCGDRKANSTEVNNPGAAYVFRYENGLWVEYDKLVPSDPQIDKNFGVDVSIDGDIIVVGAHHYDNTGAAYVFRYVDCQWVQEAKLSPSDRIDFASFGWRVDIDGPKIVVGTFEGNSAYIYEHLNGEWVETANIKNDAGRFGSEVVIKGDNVFVAARNESFDASQISTLNTLSGAVYHFEKQGESWIQANKMTTSNVGAVLFGSSLAISENALAVVSTLPAASDSEKDQGLISIYPLDGSKRKPSFEMKFSIGANGDRWGGAVELDGHNMIYSEVDIDSSDVESTGLTHIYHDEMSSNLSIEGLVTEDPYCAREGSISITAKGGVAPLTYSIDGGLTFQEETKFVNLSSGAYSLCVKDGQNNLYRECIELTDVVGLELNLIEAANPLTCNVNEGHIEVEGIGGRAPYKYSIDGVQFVEEGLFENLSIGVHQVILSDDEGCLDSLELNLEPVNKFEVLSIETTNSKCSSTNGVVTIDYQGATGDVSYMIDGQVGTGPEITALDEGNYNAVFFDEGDCEAEIEFQILSDDCPIYVPNIFSPNGDGVNDRFSIFTDENFEGSEITITIFNRWGGQIYKKKNFQPSTDSWDGSVDQRMIGAGVYVVNLQYVSSNGKAINRRETITLTH